MQSRVRAGSALILLNVATAHGPFGGHVADGLQQVSCLANAAYDEENLSSEDVDVFCFNGLVAIVKVKGHADAPWLNEDVHLDGSSAET